MSKVGKKPIELSDKVTVTINGQNINVKGPKGEQGLTIHTSKIIVKQEENMLKVERVDEERESRAFHGLYNSLIRNIVTGVSCGYKKELKLVGVGYRVQKKGEGLNLTLGYSHPIEIKAVPGISFEVDGDTKVVVNGINKQLVGQVAADIRKLRPPEPYKGKGVMYVDERIRRKAGKTA